MKTIGKSKATRKARKGRKGFYVVPFMRTHEHRKVLNQ